MRYRVFLDTNILISGIFFEGNESKILNMVELDLITSENVINELKEVTKKKLKYLGKRTLETALSEIDFALYDIDVLAKERYMGRISTAKEMITHKKDIPILAAALYADADYLLTGDTHFFTDQIRGMIKVRTTSEFLKEINASR